MKVLLLDNYDSFTYNIAQILKESGVSFDVIQNDKIALCDAAKYNKILLSPGPGMPSSAGKLMEIIKRFHKSKSILGICLGHEAICEFFGAKLINLNRIYHGVASDIIITKPFDTIFKGLPKIIKGGRYHSWTADKATMPECLRITASTNDKNAAVMAVSHIKHDIKGLQFHPESFMTGYGKKIISNWLN